LEIYQRNFPDFVCGNPTSIESLGQDEDNEVRPNGTIQKEEVQIEEPHVFRGGGHEERTTNSSRTRTNGDHSNNRNKTITITALGSRTIK
jgi:hypothetical protein